MSDPEIINLIRNEDSRGLSLVYEKFRHEFIHWIIKTYGTDPDDAREFYQASIVILYDNTMAGKLDSLQSSLKTYLFGIGKNLALQQLRLNHRKQKTGAEFYIKNYVLDNQEDKMKEEVNLEIVSQSFSTLGEPCHELLSLYYYKKKSMEEISATLGYKNPETAKNQKYKCMERLRKIVFGTLHPSTYSTEPFTEE